MAKAKLKFRLHRAAIVLISLALLVILMKARPISASGISSPDPRRSSNWRKRWQNRWRFPSRR